MRRMSDSPGSAKLATKAIIVNPDYATTINASREPRLLAMLALQAKNALQINAVIKNALQVQLLTLRITRPEMALIILQTIQPGMALIILRTTPPGTELITPQMAPPTIQPGQ